MKFFYSLILCVLSALSARGAEAIRAGNIPTTNAVKASTYVMTTAGTGSNAPVRLTPVELLNPGIFFSNKSAFSTNYSAASLDESLECTGTNQLITLPLLSSQALGKTFVIHCASTTGNVIVTNANGSDTILGALSVAVSATNRLAVRRLSTGYW